MKWLGACFFLFLSTAAANADFARCRAMSNDAARLACYDALPDDRTEMIKFSHSMAESDQVLDLSGWYAGIGGGVGLADRLDSGGFSTANTSPEIDIFAGINATHGNVVFGLEGAISARTTSSETNRSSEIIDHIETQTQWDNIGALFEYINSNPAVSIDRKITTDYRETGSPTLAARIGVQKGNALFYAKAGGGISVLDVVKTTDDTGSRFCNDFEVLIIQDGALLANCASTVPGSVLTKRSTEIVGKAIGGIGVEYHLDKIFTRLEGEISHLFWEDGITTIDAKAAFGVRF